MKVYLAQGIPVVQCFYSRICSIRAPERRVGEESGAATLGRLNISTRNQFETLRSADRPWAISMSRSVLTVQAVRSVTASMVSLALG